MSETTHGLRVIDRALAALPTAGYWWVPELHRLRGELLLRSGSQVGDAENSLHESLAIARAQGARSLELRAATSLARLERERRTGDEGFRRLGEIYSLFQEGFDTPDLQEARALLDAGSAGG